MIRRLSAAAFAAALLLAGCSKKNAAPSAAASSSAAAEVKINDPDGDYKPFSDPAITQHPPENFTLGNNQPVEFHYDGSKGSGLSYQLFYISQNGSVHPIGGGTLDDQGGGVFRHDISVFNSSADQRPGFIEITTVAGSGLNDSGQITGKNVKLGMYPIRLEKVKD